MARSLEDVWSRREPDRDAVESHKERMLTEMAEEATDDARRFSRAGDGGRARDARAAAAYLHRKAEQMKSRRTDNPQEK